MIFLSFSYPDLINNVTLLVIGVLTIYTAWKGRIIQKSQEVNQEKNSQKITDVSNKQDRIYEMVNHPMGVALAALATSLEQIARMTRTEEDIISAVNARKNSENHNKKQSEANALKLKNDMEKNKIINDFLNNK